MAYIGPEVNERQRALDQGMNNLIQGLQGYQEQKRAEALANEEAARKAKQDKLNLLTQSRQLGVSPEELQNAMTYESGLENLGRTLEENRQKELQTKGEEQKYKRDLEKQKLDIERAKLSGSLSEQAANRALKQQELAMKRAEKADVAAGKGAEGDLKSTQYTAATYAQRIEDANKEMEGLQKSGFDRTGLGTSLLSSFAPEAFKPQELKKQEQAERNFVNAVLRRESGAAIQPSEFSSAEKQYFPRVGDTADVIAQKARNRQVAMAGLQAEAGGALAQLKGRLGQPVAQPFSGGGLIPSAVAAPAIDPYQERPMTAEEKALQLEANKAALSGLQSLQSERYTPEQEAQMKAGLSQFQASQDVTNLRQGVEDARRKMQQQIAARGLQNTSIGLGQLAGQERDIGRAQAQAMNQYQYQQSATPLEAERIKRERALNLMNAARGQQIRSEFDTGKASSRQGGLLPLAGAVAGGIASGGSPQGIQAGLGVGQVTSSMY